MKKEIKYSKKIFILWIVTIIVTILSWGVALYSNVCQGRAEAKAMAVPILQKVAERVVNREFDGLRELCVSFGNDSEENHTRRKMESEAGEFELEVDSLKEAQGLYPLDVLGFKASMLKNCRKFPLEQIYMEWKDEIDARYSGVQCALFLAVHPLGSNDSQECSVGKETIIVSRYDLGTYYLDGMYTMRLTAYMMTGFWCSVDWTRPLLLVFSGFFIILVLAGLFSYIIGFWRSEKKENPNEVATTYQLGECIFDSVNRTLTYRGETQICTPQPARLLLGFAKSSDFFLSTDEIDAICNWHLDDLGIKDRRRRAISVLKKLLSVDKSIQVDFDRKRKGYQLLISKGL